MSRHAITVSDLKAMAKDCNIEFLSGDVLLVRTGWIKWYEENGPDERREFVTKGKAWVGVEGCQETVEWLWDNHFSAVAGDSIGWEMWPPNEGYSKLQLS